MRAIINGARVTLPAQVAAIYWAVAELEAANAGRKFTPDGHLGPGDLAWLSAGKRQKSGQCVVSLAKLRDLASRQRVPLTHGASSNSGSVPAGK